MRQYTAKSSLGDIVHIFVSWLFVKDKYWTSCFSVWYSWSVSRRCQVWYLDRKPSVLRQVSRFLCPEKKSLEDYVKTRCCKRIYLMKRRHILLAHKDSFLLLSLSVLGGHVLLKPDKSAYVVWFHVCCSHFINLTWISFKWTPQLDINVIICVLFRRLNGFTWNLVLTVLKNIRVASIGFEVLWSLLAKTLILWCMTL